MKTMENIETLPQKVVDRKIIILKPRLDPTNARLISEQNKISFFVKHKFLKPQSRDISLVGFSKYFEPFVLIGGKYTIDYCKKRMLKIECVDQPQRIFVGGEEIKLELSASGKSSRVISFPAEEHFRFTNETYYVLDRFMRELAPEKIHMSPFDSEPENDENFNIDSRKVTVSLEEEIAFLRSKIVKRPSDIDVVIKEMFEINERMIIYQPMYELIFQNFKTAEAVTIIIDGVTGKITDSKMDITISTKLPTPEKIIQENVSSVCGESPKKPIVEDSARQNRQDNDINQNLVTKQERNEKSVSEAELMFESEKALALAVDSMRRLGFKDKIMPLKVASDGELYSIELSLKDKTAKVLVDTKMKEVKEYEIQEINV
jgi:hypothetical protein